MILIPAPKSESIEVYFDHFIYKSNVKQITLAFEDIAFIDQDVIEGKRHTYYKSIEFLDELMQSLLFIEGEGFIYDELILLCNRISSINHALSQNGNQNLHLSIFDNSDSELS